MAWTQILGFATVGLIVGTLSGMLGIGGAVLVIPVLVMLFGFEQKMAVGTSLAMLLPPIGFFAVRQYYHAGNVHLPAAAIMAVLFAFGAWGGSWLALWMKDDRLLRVLFCVFLLYIVGNMLFRTERRVWAAAATVTLSVGYAIAYFALRAFGRRQERHWSASQLYQRRVAQSVPMDYEI